MCGLAPGWNGLLPCPCCGGAALFKRADNFEDTPNAGGMYAEFSQCGLATRLWFPIMDDVKTEIAEAWNARVEV